MKNLLFITSLLFCLTNYGQHNYDNQNVIYSQNNGVVTIGSSSQFGSYGSNDNALELSSENPSIGLIGGPSSNNRVFLSANSTFGNGLAFSNITHFGFYMFGGTGEIMRFHTNGSVSVGTTNSATGYKLSVGGKIMAEELKVQLEANWPDYVFETTYNLVSLGDLEKFINKNKHLPNIPSAKEVEKDGINVGEMNAKLLQKIEELTLYVIDLHKENEKLKKEFSLFKKNNNLK